MFVGTGEPGAKGWESYEYVIGRTTADGQTSVDKLDKTFSATNAGKAAMVQSGDVILLSVPRSAVGMADGNKFYFKAAMGVTGPSDIMNYYTSGSAMPMGRLSYMYEMAH